MVSLLEWDTTNCSCFMRGLIHACLYVAQLPANTACWVGVWYAAASIKMQHAIHTCASAGVAKTSAFLTVSCQVLYKPQYAPLMIISILPS